MCYTANLALLERLRDLGSSERWVFLALASMADETGMCWPSYAMLARRLALGRSTVIAAVAALEARSLLEKVSSSGAPERAQRRNAYRIDPSMVLHPWGMGPRGSDSDGPETGPKMVQKLDSDGPETGPKMVQKLDSDGPETGPKMVQKLDSDGPETGPRNININIQKKPQEAAAGGGPIPSAVSIAEIERSIVAAMHVDPSKSANWHFLASTVVSLITEGYSPTTILAKAREIGERRAARNQPPPGSPAYLVSALRDTRQAAVHSGAPRSGTTEPPRPAFSAAAALADFVLSEEDLR